MKPIGVFDILIIIIIIVAIINDTNVCDYSHSSVFSSIAECTAILVSQRLTRVSARVMFQRQSCRLCELVPSGVSSTLRIDRHHDTCQPIFQCMRPSPTVPFQYKVCGMCGPNVCGMYLAYTRLSMPTRPCLSRTVLVEVMRTVEGYDISVAKRASKPL